MEYPLIQQLTSQLLRLKRLGLSLHNDVQMMVWREDGTSQIIRLKDHNPKNPIVLNRDDRVGFIIKPSKTPAMPAAQPLADTFESDQVMDMAA